MAYKNIINQTATNTPNFMKILKEWLCDNANGPQWTLHDTNITDWDNIAQNDWFVIKSEGESGKDRLYYKFVYYSATAVTVYGYQYWDATSHSGVSEYFYSTSYNYVKTDSSSFTWWCYGDLDAQVIVTKIGTDYYVFTFGKHDGVVDTVPVKTTADVSAGSSVWVSLDGWRSSFKVGAHVAILDDSNAEKAKIVAINQSENKIQLESLSNSYSSGATVLREVTYLVGGYQLNTYRSYFMVKDGTKDQSSNYLSVIHSNNLGNVFYCSTDPDKWDGEYFASPIYFIHTAEAGQGVVAVVKNLLAIAPGSITSEDVLSDEEGNNWRAFSQGGGFTLVKEV